MSEFSLKDLLDDGLPHDAVEEVLRCDLVETNSKMIAEAAMSNLETEKDEWFQPEQAFLNLDNEKRINLECVEETALNKEINEAMDKHCINLFGTRLTCDEFCKPNAALENFIIWHSKLRPPHEESSDTPTEKVPDKILEPHSRNEPGTGTVEVEGDIRPFSPTADISDLFESTLLMDDTLCKRCLEPDCICSSDSLLEISTTGETTNLEKEEGSNKSDDVVLKSSLDDELQRDKPPSDQTTNKKEVIGSSCKTFVSSDPKENQDINNPEWDYIKCLETDEQRYRFVRKAWKSTVVPNPNIDLTYFAFYQRRREKEASGSMAGLFSQKRKRETEDRTVPGKRRKLFQNVHFNQIILDKAKRSVTREFNQRIMPNGRMRKHYDEMRIQLENAKEEVHSFNKFYMGLPDQTVVFQEDVEEENRRVEMFYNLFKKFYKWDGNFLLI